MEGIKEKFIKYKEFNKEEIEEYFNLCLRRIKKIADKLSNKLKTDKVLTLAVNRAFNLDVDIVVVNDMSNLIRIFSKVFWHDFDRFMEKYKLNIELEWSWYIKNKFADIKFIDLDLESLYFSYQFLQGIYQELMKMLSKKDKNSPFDIEFLKKKYPGIFKILVARGLME